MNGNTQSPKHHKSLIYSLLSLFTVFFIAGFLDLNGKLLLSVIFLLFLGAIIFLMSVLGSNTTGKMRTWYLTTAIAAIVFSLGVSYGILGIWGYFEINDLIYVGSVAIAMIGFLAGTIGSLIFSHKPDPS